MPVFLGIIMASTGVLRQNSTCRIIFDVNRGWLVHFIIMLEAGILPGWHRAFFLVRQEWGTWETGMSKYGPRDTPGTWDTLPKGIPGPSAGILVTRVDVSETFSADQLWFRILSGLFQRCSLPENLSPALIQLWTALKTVIFRAKNQRSNSADFL